MSDFCKKFIIQAAEYHLAFLPSADKWAEDIIGPLYIEQFLENETCMALYAGAIDKNGTKKINFLNELTDFHGINHKIVVFSKNKPMTLLEENICSAIHITSICGPPTLALYYELENVFKPFFAQETFSDIKRQVANLQADLRSAILHESSDTIMQADSNLQSFNIIGSLANEVEYWNTVSQTTKSSSIKNNALLAFNILSSISKDFASIEVMSSTKVEDLLESAYSALDDLWRLDQSPYTSNRMSHLMDIIANNVTTNISKQLSNFNIWSESYNSVVDVITNCISMANIWLESCRQLTEVFWPNYAPNLWNTAPYVPPDLQQLAQRLDEILKIHTLLRQLTRLLTTQEQDSLNTFEMFAPFKNLKIFEFGQYSNSLWVTARKEFENLLQPVEEKVAIKLKKQLNGINNNTRQLLHEFTRYSELISRPLLKQMLLPERQSLLNALFDYIRLLQSQNNSDHKILIKYDTSQIVADVIVIKQLEAKTIEVLETASKQLQDLSACKNLEELAAELLEDLKQQNSELFESWSKEISELIKNNILSLRESEPVVQFSKNTKLMTVNYSNRLISLISEVRQFKTLGCYIPSHIEETSQHAKMFMKLARALEQIANFHNTIGDRMIVCQKPIMLTSALELSRLVQEEEVVSWNKKESVEKYVENLKVAVEKLSAENNLLVSYYHQIMDKINFLRNIDLIGKYGKWKETVRHIRTIITQLEDKGFRNMQNWKVDIDQHLCTTLEKQYIHSLDSLHLYLPEIYTDITYKNGELQFSPTQTILMEKYQLQVQKILDIPKTFRGVLENSKTNNFLAITERNQDQLVKVNKHTATVVEQLEVVLKHWHSWLQLDFSDISSLTDWQHWDMHFRASKTFAQEIAKFSDTEERVECFIIGLSRLRSDLELYNRSYWDQLVVSLKESITNDVVKLQTYVDSSTAFFNKQPVTLEEVCNSGAFYDDIIKQSTEMEEIFKVMSLKSQTLSSWTREQIDSVSRIKGSWERLQNLSENYQHIMGKQMETVKTTLNIDLENIEKEMEKFASKWDLVKLKFKTVQFSEQTIDELHQYWINIQEHKQILIELIEKKENLFEKYQRFSVEKPVLLIEETVVKDFYEEESSWSIFEEFITDLDLLATEPWIVFRKKMFCFEDFLTNWQKKLKTVDPNVQIVTRILQEIQKYEEVLPCLKYVKGENFTEKHWIDVFNILEMSPQSLENLNLKHFLNMSDKLTATIKDLQIISKKAASEIVLRQVFSELDQWDVQTKFQLTSHTYSQNKTIMLVKEFKDLLNKIGDHQSLLQSIKTSVDYDSVLEQTNLWENKLANLDQYLTSLAQIQRKWIYLEPIFGNGTLIEEKSRFDKIQKDFTSVLAHIEKTPRVSSLCRYHNLAAILTNLLHQLGLCQKSLDTFLSEKRDKFPRFYFLGDDDLLEIVGQSSKKQVIQTHLKKLFAGIGSITLDKNENITAMCSIQEEIVSLKNSVSINKPIEDWLNSLVNEMQSTLKELLVECLKEGQNADPLKYPSQILCLADSITFTLKTEQAISNMTLPPLLVYYKTQLIHYSSLELNLTDEVGQTPLNFSLGNESSTLELTLKALLLDTIHHISVLNELLDKNITKITDWVWQKQLRFYSNSSGVITVKMANARMDYAYEYLGNSPKLVRTHLTDRCFLALTQGMHLGMGGNPYGPAGTGKTESVKALGGLLGRQVLVFNCDKGIDATSMSRILSGLVQSGAWGCFDEFNRLDEATLSAVSMQIQPIQMALKNREERVVLLEQNITVNKHCGIFVTLNPAGENYGGRNKLPDNLKQLLRPVAMTHPDNEQITTTLLHCDGFQNAEIIGKKLIETFKCCSKLLSNQQHYDWGLRAIKSIIGGCAKALKQHRRNTEEAEGNQLLTEMSLVVKVLRSDTLSKLTFADSVKFSQLLENIFQNVGAEDTDNIVLVKALEESCNELNLTLNRRQIAKCLELYDQVKNRMGVAIVGPPSSGKSSIRNLLCHALNKIKPKLKQYVFNPKSVEKSQLLGEINAETREWSDGILSLYGIQVTSEPKDVWSWIVFDGNIDPEWVEALNSVLDDNRLLSLPSGWRIQFESNVNFIFETHDLSHASPATISRIGIILLSEEDLNLDFYVESYLKKQPEDIQAIISPYQHHFLKSVKWICTEAETTVATSKVAIAKTGLTQLGLVNNKREFTVSLINGLGQQLQEDFQEVYAQQVYQWMDEISPPFILRSRYNKERDIIDTYHTNPNLSIPTRSLKVSLILTGFVLKILDSLRIWLTPYNEQHFLLIGPRGSAKTLILEYLVKERSDMELETIYCSSTLSADYVINKIAQLCISVNSNKGKIYKPKKGYLVLYFKNLELLSSDKWGTNTVVEFLHQIITYKAFFDVNLELIGIENVLIVGSVSATDALSKRFISIVCNYNVSLPKEEDLTVVVVTYLLSISKECFKTWSKTKIVKLASTMITIFNKIKSSFEATYFKHYGFNPSDVTDWCANIFRYKDTIVSESEKSVLEIIYYEAKMLFGDKLVSENDRDRLLNMLDDIFKVQWSFVNTTPQEFYVPQMSAKGLPLQKLNEEDWSSAIKQGIAQYGRDSQQLNVLVNVELLKLCASVAKVLTVSSGHAVLVGRSGIGRKSAIKIVSALQSAHIIIPTTHQFKTDLKNAVQLAAIEGYQVYFLLEDHIFHHKNILSLINILISNGEIYGLFNSMELEAIISGLKEEVNRENYEGSLHDFFQLRVKQRLHVITCLDVDNIDLWNIFENCPAFLHRSSIIWKTTWSKATTSALPTLLIDKYNQNSNELNKVEHSQNVSKIFDNVQEKTPNPLQFISMINLYIDCFVNCKTSIIARKKKLEAGVAKLTEARNLVDELKQKAAEKQSNLEEKQAKANAALDMISHTMKNANTHKEEMEVLKQKTESENQILISRKKEIEIELLEVEPLIQEARASVGNIKSESLSEIRSMRAPPEIIRDILEGVLRLMGIQDTSWNSMKTFLAKRGVKEEIRSFNASRISSENQQAVEKLIVNKKDSFDAKIAKRASVAAAPLAAWVIANVKYSRVLDKIRPLEKEQTKLQQNLATTESQLGELSAGLSDVDVKVAKLKEQLSSYTKEAAEVEISLNEVQTTLKAAQGLVSKLEDEYQRWQEQLKELAQQLEALSDNSSLAAAFITYLPQEPEEKRRTNMDIWMKDLGVANFIIEEFTSNEREKLQWQNEGLFSDKLSVQNAVILLKTQTTPLLIDPTSNATCWFKNHFKHQPTEILTDNSPKFSTNLELAVKFGKILIIEEIETISPILLPILRKEFVNQGDRKLIKLNGKLIDYNDNFRLVLSTRNEHLNITAQMEALISKINFCVSYAGLSEQLLSSIVRQENPKLEDKKTELLRQRDDLQEQQYQLQNRLLEDLAYSAGDILHNYNLLNSLNETKASSIAITEALKDSSSIQTKLEAEYEVYRDITLYGSYLYFACNEFAKMNVLYAISVSSFIKLFLSSLQTFQGIERSIPSQKKHLLLTAYNYIARGILKTDRLTFGLYLVQKLCSIPLDEWRLFLGNVIPEHSENSQLPFWIPKQSVQYLENIQATLPELFKKLQLDQEAMWVKFMSSENSEKHLPSHCKISDFQKVLIIQALRSDRTFSAITECVLNLTGLNSIDPPFSDLKQIYKESSNAEPILIITQSGTDPSSEIRELAGSNLFLELAMGEGQENKAISALEESAKIGQWLILKNLHLVTGWLPILSQHLQNLTPHETFRIWLITEPNAKFNIVLAQHCLKIVCEAPRGLRNNLEKIFNIYGNKFFEKLQSSSARIFFVLSFIHAILQERRTYIPQGWSKWYDFSDTDLITCVRLVEDLWQSSSSQIQWEFISGLCCDAVYGGKIENADDMTILNSFLKQYLSDEILSHRWSPFGSRPSLPITSNFHDYINAIRQVPEPDVPSYFGLPENINRAWEKQTSSEIVTKLKTMFLTKDRFTTFDRDFWQKTLTPFIILWKKLNQGKDFIRMSIPILQLSNSSIETFFSEEFQNALQLIQKIHKRFAALNKICKGSSSPSDCDFVMANALSSFQVPKEWRVEWEGSKDPSIYLRSLITKAVNLAAWKDKKLESILQHPINLSILLHPAAFLVAYKQDFSRLSDIPMDQLESETHWATPNKKNYIILSDLLMEGGLFDGNQLKPCLSDSENLNSVPHCYLSFIDMKLRINQEKMIDIPLYCDLQRETALTSLQILCNGKEKAKWIQSGLAFYTEY